MSGKQVGLVFELDVPPRHQVLLLALADNAHHDGTRCYPGVGLLAWKTGYSTRNVRRLLRDLEDANLIEPIRYGAGGRGMATEYELHLERGQRKTAYEAGQNVRLSVAKGGQDEPETRTSEAQKADTQVSAQPRNRQRTVTPQPPQAGERPIEPTSGRARDWTAYHDQLAAWAPHPSAAPELETIWTPARQILRELVERGQFDLWIAGLHPHRLDGATLVLGAPTEATNLVRKRFERVLTGALAGRAFEIVPCAEEIAA